MSSGRLGPLDGESRELGLFCALEHALISRGIAVLRFDLPTRERLEIAPTPEHLEERTTRLRQVLEDPGLATSGGSRALIGMSLGGVSILRLLAEAASPPVARIVVLAGTVIDEPCTVMQDVEAIHLYHGARDWIAYAGERRPAEAIAPEDYVPRSRAMLVVRRHQTVRSRIVAGGDHFLATSAGGPADGVVEEIAEVVAGRCSAVDSRTPTEVLQ